MAAASASSGFPRFTDGDVCIVVSTSKIYQLHSHVLRRVSSWFSDFLEPATAAKLSAVARREGCAAWRFHLFVNPHHPHEIGQFVPIDLTDSGKIREQQYPPRGPHLGVGNEDLDKCWDWLFGCFYGIPPDFDDSTFAATVQDCFKLVDVANNTRSLEHIQEVVDLALMRQDEVLWKSIASSPTIWADLAYRVQSPAIFKEAVIHIIGRWKMESEQTKSEMPKAIYDLCEKKRKEMELAKRAIEIRIAGHYPSFLCRNHADKPHRTAYAADIYMWMALSFFRQYMAQAGNDEKTRLADDGGYDYYRKFATGGNAYLHHEDMSTFHQYFPMSSKACSVFEAHMNVLKEEVKVFVRDLMIVRTHVNPADLEVDKPWLTCAVIDKEDLPWYLPEDLKQAVENNIIMDDDSGDWTVVDDGGNAKAIEAATLLEKMA